MSLFGLLGSTIKTGVDVVTTPLDVAGDMIEGGQNDRTAIKIEKIGDDIEDVGDELLDMFDF